MIFCTGIGIAIDIFNERFKLIFYLLKGGARKKLFKSVFPAKIMIEKKESIFITFEMETGDKIKAELYEDIAPISVKNFISLVEKGFYDGLIFHRVIPGFMIQGGCPEGSGMGGPGYQIKGEFAANGVSNSLAHKRGVLSMARSSNPNSAGSQFFIMHQDSPHLDGQYAAFGKVVEGIEIVDKIAQTPTDWQDRPKNEWKMKKLSISYI